SPMAGRAAGLLADAGLMPGPRAIAAAAATKLSTDHHRRPRCLPPGLASIPARSLMRRFIALVLLILGRLAGSVLRLAIRRRARALGIDKSRSRRRDEVPLANINQHGVNAFGGRARPGNRLRIRPDRRSGRDALPSPDGPAPLG